MGRLFTRCVCFAVCGGQQRLCAFLFGKPVQAQIRELFLKQSLANPTLRN